MPKLTIDNRDVEVRARATILDAARQLGIAIPTLCHRQGFAPQTSCMVCVVRVNGSERLVPSCATHAEDGMVVESETEPVLAARRMALELLLGDHVGDCLAPCQLTCPAHLDIPRVLRLIAQRRFHEALEVTRQRIPFPAILGRICPELCERACRRKDLDSPVSVKLLKRYIGDWALESEPLVMPTTRPPTGKSVAVVGAGPAGLSAAYYLLKQGHGCTILDDHEQLGGGMRYGVWPDLLPAEVLDAETDIVFRLGAEVRPDTRVGENVPLEDLRRDFDAVLLCIGEVTADGAGTQGLPLAAEGLRADRDTHMTLLEGVFVAGSTHSPSRYAVRALASGTEAARQVSHWLADTPMVAGGRPYSVHRGRLSEQDMIALAADTPRHGRVRPAGNEGTGLSEQEAMCEAERCLHCECSGIGKCRLRDYAVQYGARARRYPGSARVCERVTTHPELTYEPGKCISCGLCIQVAGRAGEPLGLSFLGRGFTMVVGAPFDESLADALQKSAHECVAACPTGALMLRAEASDGVAAADAAGAYHSGPEEH